MILYAAIARLRDAGILVQISEPSWKGNAGQVCSLLVSRLRDYPETVLNDERRTFVHRNDAEEADFFYHFIEACSVALGDDAVEEHFFHVFRKDGVLYCCLGDDPDPRDHAVHFAFLDLMQREFVKMYGPRKIDVARANSLEKAFGPSIRSAIHHHNIHHNELKRDAKVQAIMSKIEDFKAVMGKNINLMMENTVAASNLLTLSDEMRVDAQVFKKKAKRLTYKEKKRHCFTILMGILVAVVLLYMAVIGICGFQLDQCRASGSRSGSNGGSGASSSSTTSSSSSSSGNDDAGGNAR